MTACRFRASFDTRRQAESGLNPGWVAYFCDQHDKWHVRLDLTETS